MFTGKTQKVTEHFAFRSLLTGRVSGYNKR